MPSKEDIAKFYQGEDKFESHFSSADEKAAALGWNGPKKDPRWDDNGQWTGPVPDPDRPVNENYLAARVSDGSVCLDDAGIRRMQALEDLNAASTTFSAPDPQVFDGTYPDDWREQFTKAVEALGQGFTWNYDGNTGDIHVSQGGNKALIHRNTASISAAQSARAWVAAETVKKRRRDREEFLRAEDERRAREERASDLTNPVNAGAALQAVLERLDDIAGRLEKLEQK